MMLLCLMERGDRALLWAEWGAQGQEWDSRTNQVRWVQASCTGQEHHKHWAGVVRAPHCEGLSSLPHGPPFLLQSIPPAHRGTSPGWSPRGAVGPQVTSMAQRMQLASVPSTGPSVGTGHQGPWVAAPPSEQGRRAERLHQATRSLLCSAPAPQGSLSLLPSSHGWQESISLSVHPSLLVSPELSGEGQNVQIPLQLW